MVNHFQVKIVSDDSIMAENEAESTETPTKVSMDFGELRNDTDFITKSTNLEKVSVLFRFKLDEIQLILNLEWMQ